MPRIHAWMRAQLAAWTVIRIAASMAWCTAHLTGVPTNFVGMPHACTAHAISKRGKSHPFDNHVNFYTCDRGLGAPTALAPDVHSLLGEALQLAPSTWTLWFVGDSLSLEHAYFVGCSLARLFDFKQLDNRHQLNETAHDVPHGWFQPPWTWHVLAGLNPRDAKNGRSAYCFERPTSGRDSARRARLCYIAAGSRLRHTYTVARVLSQLARLCDLLHRCPEGALEGASCRVPTWVDVVRAGTT